jgi:hypothetical protein
MRSADFPPAAISAISTNSRKGISFTTTGENEMLPPASSLILTRTVAGSAMRLHLTLDD